MLIIFTGNGKGKTTAALGQALRAVGDDKKVLMIQFIKGPWKSGEDRSHRKLSPKLKIVKKGKGFIGIGGDTLPREDHEKAAQDGLTYAEKQIASGDWNMLILDEIWNAVCLKLITIEKVEEFVRHAMPKVEHLIMTGRYCPKQFIEKADLVTEMKEIKHPFMNGVTGAKGLEY
jgi:cob(I)alamin adenosyltransferase